MQLLPGFGSGSPSAVTDVTAGLLGRKPPASLPPLPTRRDPEIAAARKKQRDIELRRKGRRSTILTSGRGVEDQLGVSRPQARGAELLGQTGG